MYTRPSKVLTMLITVIFTISACSMPELNPSTDSTITQTAEVALTPEIIATSASTEVALSTEVPPTDAAIQHSDIPVNLPIKESGHAGDQDSSSENTAPAIGGDRFSAGRYERPFNANTMDIYFPYLDIVDTFVFQDETWVFATLTVKGPDSNNALPGKYAIEIDLDRNGKGDWLIIVSNPSSTEWTVTGVQAFEDADKDVGNEIPAFADMNAAGNGFESLVFDQGSGTDADAAWVRIAPNNPNTIEFAVKRSLLGGSKEFMINMWAGNSLLSPSLFDINDHFTPEQAGAADSSFSYYPIKEVAEIDNTCRMAVGFQPTGKEPGLCQMFIPERQGEPAQAPTQPAPPNEEVPTEEPFCGCSCVPC